MNLLDRVKQWIRQRRRQRAAEKFAGATLREFVYLDEVSIYSLTASRLGSIATEFTEREARTLATEAEANAEASLGIARGGTRAKSSASREQSSQVVRKSIVQTAFKDLFELEAGRLALRVPEGVPPSVTSLADIERLTDDAVWAVDPSRFERGKLAEVEVELEAEAVFRINAVVSAFLEIVHEDLEVFGVNTPFGIAEARAMNRVLDRLLTGLVPLRGHSTHYVVAQVGDRDLVVHKDLVEALPVKSRPVTWPLTVVGVAEQRLFWKDVRRVLFSQSRYRMFCRIAYGGLRQTWSPVKLADVLREVVPEFEAQLLGVLGESTLSALGEASDQASNFESRRRHLLLSAGHAFAVLVLQHHQKELEQARIASIVETVVGAGGSLETVGGRRAFFGPILRAVDEAVGVSTSVEVAEQFRVAATEEVGLGLGGSLAPRIRKVETPSPETTDERFLDTEVVAIYW